MQIAVIGNGKTGSEVVNLLGSTADVTVYDSKNILTASVLDNADVAIIFVSAEVLKSLLPILTQSKTPIICGTTGFYYSQEFINRVVANQQTWVVANNFSLSMVVLKKALATLGKLEQLHNSINYEITEKHHIHKLDAPSGTAVSWQQWLNVNNAPISSIREGDIKGEHKVQITTPSETIMLEHVAQNRKLFAEGAIWAAKEVLATNITGFINFEDLVGERACL